MKVLLTGSQGQLGRCFQNRLPTGWEIWATDANTLDITDSVAVGDAVNKFFPDIIVNAAAYTAVDKAETEQKLAMNINAIGPKNLAVAAKKINARFVTISTDYVFDGTSGRPYIETDITNPLSVYGLTKRDGECMVSEVLPESIIIRTSWVFSEYGKNFVKTMLNLSKTKPILNIVSDQRGCPTYAGDIAGAIICLLVNKAKGGVYHYCGDTEVSWSDFAKIIFSIAKEQRILVHMPEIKEIKTEDYPTEAVRPKYSSLACQKISSYCTPSDWHTALRYVLPRLD